MASDRIADAESAFNSSSNPFDYRLPKYLADLSDEFIFRLMQARALLAVAQHGLFKCSESDHYHFLIALDDIVVSTLAAFREIVNVHRDNQEEPSR